MKHAKLSPSGAFRWLECPGSIRLSVDIEDTSSPAAEEGTTAHTLGEKALVKGKKTKKIKGDYPPEMRDYVQQYVDYVNAIPGKLQVEKRLDISMFVPGSFGTSDALVLDKRNSALHVVDLKYGMNMVWPRDNPQLMLYAAGALMATKEKVKTVVMHICQPRKDHWPTHEIKAKDLLKWAKGIRPRAELCLTEDAPLNPSDGACRYCLAAPTCPALEKRTLEVVGGDFEALPATETLTIDQIAFILSNKKLVIDWMTKLEGHAQLMMEGGEQVPGFKLVRARSYRKYLPKAKEALPEILGDNAWKPRELITLSAAEKLVGKAEFENLGITVKPEGKITVAPDSDNRKAVTTTADDFQ